MNPSHCYHCEVLERVVLDLKREVFALRSDVQILKNLSSNTPFSPVVPPNTPDVARPTCSAPLLPLPRDLHPNHPLSPDCGAYRRSEKPAFPPFVTFRIQKRNTVIAKTDTKTKHLNHESTVVLDDIEVVGDSLIRDQGPIIYKKCTGKNIRSTPYPSGGINTVSQYILSSDYSPKFSVICVGSNDIHDTDFDNLKNKFSNLLISLKSKRCYSLVLGVLPRLNETSEWKVKARRLNSWIRDQCSSNSLAFLDLWDIFSPDPSLFIRDQIHLNYKGKNLLADIILQHLTLPNFLD